MRVAGLGFRSVATVASLRDALERAGARVDLLATDAGKAGAKAIGDFAAELGLEVRAVDRAALARQVTLTQSVRVAGRFGAGSVAEAAALAAAGPGARLLGPRVVSGDGLAVAAIAERTDE